MRENGALSSIRFNSLLKNRHTHSCASSPARSSLIVSAVALAGTKCGRDEKRYIRVSACTHKHVIHLHTYHVPAPMVEVELPIYMLRLGCSWVALRLLTYVIPHPYTVKTCLRHLYEQSVNEASRCLVTSQLGIKMSELSRKLPKSELKTKFSPGKIAITQENEFFPRTYFQIR